MAGAADGFAMRAYCLGEKRQDGEEGQWLIICLYPHSKLLIFAEPVRIKTTMKNGTGN